ncbi:MAG: LarC family nickel insertion protein [Synergistota bacterium]|nr:LarC family nickel insertion protein [Synergistota bacterium]
MERILYLNCLSGVSGDMFLGAMIDLLGDDGVLDAALKGLRLGNYEIAVGRERRRGITGVRVSVKFDSESHHGRNLNDIVKIIEGSSLSDFVKSKAREAFTRLAEVEGKIHGVPLESIHFHEVGGIDSIVDIVGAFTLLERLEVDRIVSSPVNVGSGFVNCAHGILPVPAPATAELLKDVPVFSLGEPMERTTPTGALLLKMLASAFGPLPLGVLKKVGYGAGERESSLPNVLQAILLEGEVPLQ